MIRIRTPFLLPFGIIAINMLHAETPATDIPPVRIMPLGDSITEGCCSDQPSGSYRKHLHAMLAGQEYNVDFVGTLRDTIPSELPDTDHQGAPGFGLEHIAKNIGVWLKQIDEPDVILIHAGTNDFWVGSSLEEVTDRLERLLDRISGLRPQAKIIVASLILRGDQYETIQAEFATILPRIVAKQVAMGRHVFFADLHDSLDFNDLMNNDGVHPSTSGFIKMAGSWLPAITSVINPEGTADAPTIDSVDPDDSHQSVVVNFSKPVADSAADAANYSISENIAVIGASLDMDSKRSVTLTTEIMEPGILYTITANNIHDRTPDAIPIRENTTIDFTSKLVVNGSFEAGNAGWDATGSVVSGLDNIEATSGSKVAVFYGDQPDHAGALSQTMATKPGLRYRLDFDVGLEGESATSRRLNLSVAGHAPLVTHTESLDVIQFGDPKWTLQSAEFIADSELTTIAFQEMPEPDGGGSILLDDVSIVLNNTHNALLNGGFEIGGMIRQGYYLLEAWSSSGNVVGLASDGSYSANEGNRVAFFNQGGDQFDGVVSQEFDTIPGQTYTVSYDVGIIGPVRGTRQRLVGTVTGGSAEPLASWQDDLEVVSAALAPAYVRKFRSFTADSGRTTLTFRDAPPGGPSNNSDLMLDDVRVLLAQDRTLTVSSEHSGGDELTGVQITVNLPDLDGLADGSTGFTRRYSDIQEVGLTAPAIFDGLVFRTWRLNGVDLGTDPAVSITMGADHTLAAVYGPHIPPVANDDLYVTQERTPRIIRASHGVLSNDTYEAIAGTPSAELVPDSGPFNGSLTLQGDGGFVYVPNSGFNGTDSFRYLLNDGMMKSSEGVVTIEVMHGTGGLLANGGFEIGDPIRPTDAYRTTLDGWLVSGNVTGLVSVYKYASNEGIRMAFFNEGGNQFDGIVSQEFDTEPGKSYTLSYDVGIIGPIMGTRQRLVCTVTGESAEPIAAWQDDLEVDSPVLKASYVRKYRSFTAISSRTTVTFRDQAPGGPADNSDLMLDDVRVLLSQERTLSVSAEHSAGGVLSGLEVTVSPQDLDGLAGGIAGFSRRYADTQEVELAAPTRHDGLVFRTWRLNGIDLVSAPVVKVTMGSDHVLTAVYGQHIPPLANDDSYVTQERTPRIVRPENGILANDTYESHTESLTAGLAPDSGPFNGTVTLESDGSFVYVPDAGYLGTDSFKYRTNDGVFNSNEALVTIEVLPGTGGLLANGGFEIGDFLQSSDAYRTALDGWSVEGKVTGLISIGTYSASAGKRMAFFNEGGNQFNGMILQQFDTEPGRTYTVSYDVGIIGPRTGTRQRLVCTVTGESAEPIMSWQDDLEVVSPVLEAAYVRRVYSFVANSVRTTLTFRDQAPDGPADNSDLMLDDVRVYQVYQEAPENNPPSFTTNPVRSADGTAESAYTGTLAGSASDPDGDELSFTKQNGPAWLVVANDGTLSGTPHSDDVGINEFTIVVTDGSKNAQAVLLITILDPTPSNDLEQWLAEYNLSEGPEADSDRDGISNLIEYVIGGNPADRMDVDMLPSAALVTADPADNGNTTEYLLFTHRRTLRAAANPLLVHRVEWSTNLQGDWREASENVAKDATPESESVVIRQHLHEPGVEMIEVFIPRSYSLNDRLFVRMACSIADSE
jgi:lysophospholipase L1-like esterase